MKKILIPFLLVIAACWIVFAQDREGATIRYRIGAILKFDTTATIKDEDGHWTITHTQLGKLSVLQSGTSANSTNKTVTNTFTTAFSSTPTVVLTAGTNDLPHIVSVSTSNVIIGAAQTNATIHWIAIGSP